MYRDNCLYVCIYRIDSMTKNKISDVCTQLIKVFPLWVEVFRIDEQPNNICTQCMEVFGRNRSRKMIVKFVLCVLFLRTVSGELMLPLNESGDSVTGVIERLFGVNETVCIITDGIMSDVEFNIPNPKIIWNLNTTQKLGKQPTVYNFILQVNDSNSLGNALNRLKESPLWHAESTPSGTFLIIISAIDNVFEKLWMYPITNSVILVNSNGSSKCKLYQSTKWSVRNECGKRPNVIYEEDCQDGPTLTFKKGFRSYHSCPVHSDIYKYSGSKVIQATLAELRKRYGLHLILGNDVDYFPLPTTSANWRTTSTVRIEHLIWIMPEPKRVPPLKLYLIIFQKEVWIMVAVGFLLTISFYVIISLYKRIPVNLSTFGFIIMQILSLTFWGCCSRIPNITSLRVLLLSYIFYAIVVQTGYVSNLIRVQTIPQFEPGINSIRELINSDFRICTRNINFYNNNQNHSLLRIANKEIEYHDYRSYSLTLRCIILGKCPYAAILNCVDANLMFRRYKTIHNKLIFDDSVLHTNKFGFATLKEHYFFDTLNRVVTGLTENGFYARLNEEDYEIVKNATRSFKFPMDPQVLQLRHIYGVFVIWGFCLGISFLVFILEIIVHKLQVCKSNTIKPITATVEEEEVEIIDIE